MTTSAMIMIAFGCIAFDPEVVRKLISMGDTMRVTNNPVIREIGSSNGYIRVTAVCQYGLATAVAKNAIEHQTTSILDAGFRILPSVNPAAITAMVAETGSSNEPEM